MQIRNSTLLYILLLIFTFSACKIQKTIDFETADILKIEIADIKTINKSDEKFKEIISFINDQKEGWQNPRIGTYPTPGYTILFYDEYGFTYSIFIGNNWIGTTYKGKQYIKDKDNKEINGFLNKIGLKPI